MILEHLLEMEVNQSEAVNKLVKTVNEVNGQVSSLEEWLALQAQHAAGRDDALHPDHLAGERQPGAAEEEPRGAGEDGGGVRGRGA